MQKISKDFGPYASPISVLEELFHQFEWPFDVTSPYEFSAELVGRWSTYRFVALWLQEMDAVMFGCFIDLNIPQERWKEVQVLLTSINPKVWIGHFEIAPGDDVPTFRYNLSLRGTLGPTLDQVEDIVTAALVESDRLYPALQFVFWGGKTSEEALEAAMLETHGDA